MPSVQQVLLLSKCVVLSLLLLRLGLVHYPDGNLPVCSVLQGLLSCTLMDVLVVAIGVHLACESFLSCLTFSFQLNLSGLLRVIRCRDMPTASSVIIVLSVISLLHLVWVFKMVRAMWVENYFLFIQILHVLQVAIIAVHTVMQGMYLVCAQCAQRGRFAAVISQSRDRFGGQMKLQAFFNIVFAVYTMSFAVMTRTSEVKLGNYELLFFSVCAFGEMLYRGCCVIVEYHLARAHTPGHIIAPIENPLAPEENVDVQHPAHDQSMSGVRLEVQSYSHVNDVIPFKDLAEPVPKHELCGLPRDHRTEQYKHSRIVFPAHCRQLPPGLQNEASELVCPVRKRRVIKQTLNLPVE